MPKFLKVSLLSFVLIAFLAGSSDVYSYIIGDLDQNHIVDSRDLRILAWEWLNPDCLLSGCQAELDSVDGVSMGDFAVLANNWQNQELHLLISEFMASNTDTLLDGDGKSSDWIEIYNPMDTPVSPDGWYLTDNDANLTKWRFPDGLWIGPGEFLIVFASGKTYAENPLNYPYLDPLGYYHTNFNLNQESGYLALVASYNNRIAVIHEYRYPVQLTNVSYGLVQHASTLVPTGATASYLVPTAGDSSKDWTNPSFDDSSWDIGTTALGFGVESMPDNGLIAFYEFEGNVNDSSGNGHNGTIFGDITYEQDPEMGWVLSLPGGSNQYVLIGEVGISGNMPRTIACWAKADHTLIPDWTLIFGFTTIGGGCGSHFNVGSLGGPGGVGAHAWCWEETIFSDEQALEWRHYAMSFDGTTITYYGDGVMMDTDPLKSNVVDLSLQADNVHIGSRITQDSSFPGNVENACIYNRVLSDDEIEMVMAGSVIGTDIQNEMQNVNASMWTRIEFEIEDPSFYDMLTLRMKYEDGFAAYLNGQPVASRNAPTTLHWDSTALADRPIEDSSVFENFNIMAHLGVLRPKPEKNVLAIHGLNDNENNGEFLILPEMIIAKNQTVPQYFSTATPGAFNVVGSDVVGEVWFSHKRGFYDTQFLLTLSTRTEGAEIRYTTDGSLPTITHGNIYSTPILINKTSTVRAVAVKPGFLDSDVETRTYIFVSDVIYQSPNGEAPGPGWPTVQVNDQVFNYGMDPDIVTSDPRYVGIVDDALLAIPTFSFVTDLENLFDPSIGIYVNASQEGLAWERPVSVELIYPDGSEGFQIDAGMRIRGGYSAGGWNPKHAFRLFFRAMYGGLYGEGKLRYPLFGDEGVDEFDHMDLRCSQNYSWAHGGGGGSANTVVRDVFSRDVQGMMGHPYTKSRYYHLYINGVYWGLFQTQERSEATFGETYMGGDKEDYDVISSNWSAGRQMVPTDGNRQSLDRLYYETTAPATETEPAGFASYERYYRAQRRNIDGTPYSGSDPNYEKLLDVENLIDFMIIEYYSGDSDGPGSRYGDIPNNTWGMYNRVNPDGYKWFHHDNEHSLGSGGADGSIENLVTPFTTAGASIQYFNPHWLHEQLANTNVDYRIQFADHVYRHMFNDGLLTVEQAREHVQTRADQINMAIIGESARWGDASYHPARTKDDDWLAEINRLLYGTSDPWGRQTYITPRIPVVIGQYRDVGWYPYIDPPGFNQHGGEVDKYFNLTMSTPSGTIYYTTDGNDPRVPTAISGPGTSVAFVSENAFKRVLVPTESLSGGIGSILCEYWMGISGQAVSDLTSSPDYPGNPSSIEYRTSFEIPLNWADYYGTRMRGYLHPPATGNYTFWIASDDNSELWLSTNEDPANKTLIANVPGWTNSREWYTYSSQQSLPITLTDGRMYYIEALQKEGSGGDNLAVTWEGGGIIRGNPINGMYLSPAGETWATSYFDDTGWPSGTGGVGYERNPGDPVNYTGLFNINVESDMYGNNGTCYIRIPFTVSHTDLSDLTLRVRYDDGFVAYLNGVEVKRRNFVGAPQWDSVADDLNEDVNAISFEDFDISGHIDALQAGDNILAIQGLNYGTTSSDFLISVELVGTQVNQGDVWAGATQYTGGVILDKSTHVKARVYNDGAWSALRDASFAIGPVAENLRITEIMYHPRNTGNINDPNEEFIELTNIGPTTLNLNLVKFTEGIEFTFPAIDLAQDEHVVVVKDIAAFKAQYGQSVTIAGQYTGSLANNGEDIRLEDAIGRTILDFEFKDGWHQITDGDGFSLTMIEPDDSAAGWSEEGLVAHWKLDDNPGSTIAINSASTNDGILHGNPVWTTGRIDGALSFDGSGDYVSAGPVGALAGDTFTAQAWVRTDASAGIWNPILAQKDSGNNGYFFYVANDKPSFYIVSGGVSKANVVSPDIINADQWYHVAVTNDGSTLKLYVDGQLKDSEASAGYAGVNENVDIGSVTTASLYYKGLIDDVRIYNRPVSESEFQEASNPMLRWSRGSSWRPSVYRNGTPGWDDGGRLPNPGAVVINEVMSHSNAGPDWIELHNTTGEPINIGGWFLSDNDRDEPNLMKYRIADGTMIGGNDYIVFYQDVNFSNPGDPGCIAPFALSENGEQVYLSSRLDPNGMLTGYREAEDFGASQTNVSFGRYFKISTGTFNFVAMDYDTPDVNNAYPKVGPVVINEIMYNPPTGNQNEEYIELHNITSLPVTLYRVEKATPWKFTDGIDYTFSATSFATIPPGGYLMVVKDKTAFEARYGTMPFGVDVVGGYDGWLSNAGERLQIAMPGDIDELGTRYYIRIDRVTYSDGSHPEDAPGGVDDWPTGADGNGKSLSRKVASDYGNDVANWEAAAPSPGTANP
jgi:hypothetical protein